MNFGPIVPEMPAAGLPRGAYLLDVREDDEWVAGHAPDAVHIPLGELGGRTEQVPRNQEVYVICRAGVTVRLRGTGPRRGRLECGQCRRWHARLGIGGQADGERVGRVPLRRLATLTAVWVARTPGLPPWGPRYSALRNVGDFCYARNHSLTPKPTGRRWPGFLFA